jgi:hypothetical protein
LQDRLNLLAVDEFGDGCVAWPSSPQIIAHGDAASQTRAAGVVGIFPGLVGVVPADRNDEWTESRRYLGLEILAACRKTAQPDMGQNITAEAGLTIEAVPHLKWKMDREVAIS